MNKSKPNLSASQAPITLPFLLLTVVFIVCLIVSNIIEIKTIDFGWFTITAGMVVFPISYIINDCVVEVYGFAKARLMIWIGFAMSILVALLLQLALALPGGEAWGDQDAMQTVFGAVPRIVFASFAAFLCGSMVNAYVMSRMKALAGNTRNTRMSFSARAILSTLGGEGVDSLIFFPIAFAGVMPWTTIFSLIVTQALLKTTYEILILPVTIKVVRLLKRYEDIDTVDQNISYKWWSFS